MIMRKIKYSKSINETLHQLFVKDKKVFLIGQGITSPWYVGTTTTGLINRFGSKRVFDTPVSENGSTGLAIGSAFTGMHPILMHPRMDFMYYAMDQIANHAANWYYMFGGQLNVPITIWGIINRGGEQSAQHSQALQGIFAHIPGLKVVMPSDPYTAKGLLVSSVNDGNPVIYIDDRWLYNMEGEVPEELYSIEIGKSVIRKKGEDITIVASSYMVYKILDIAKQLEKEGISVELIDLLTVKPFDKKIIYDSVKKTKHLMIVDTSWKSFGISAEISASIAESNLFSKLKSPITRVGLPDIPAPASCKLENDYYINEKNIYSIVKKIII